ncbi:Uncharacterised protein [Vibrio cholerae]|uniref:Uncharacterized protein n=1 Tax=Vibrio cholerae TaxID=666 RepID=A0A655TAI1_VIBCL|nr:Uncharacterised protein [Vibrio cholerae]CSB70394.1 Uncharacterised protein [Vibrio cholerae]CSB86045.1 Uncharacterised protein [Vibrio cholerae]CSC10160.1 Uncharacterised protein [Vibrio cholerae]CSC41773.1 Uncharacterised protein [Vibrio cholerae]
MLVYHLAHACGGGVVWHAFKQNGFCAIRQWAIHQIGVTRYPTHISGTPEHFIGLIVEYIFEGHSRINQITASGVQYAFRFTG